jgi:autotransporter-associated beta strand protein
MKTPLHPARILSARIAAALFASASLAHAADGTWTGLGGDDLFTNPDNWLGGIVPGAATGTTNPDAATFRGDENTFIDLDAGRNLRALLFTNTGPGLGEFNLAGEPVTFSSSGLVQLDGAWSAVDQFIENDLFITSTSGTNDLLLSTANGYAGTFTFSGTINSTATSGTTAFTTRAGLGSTLVIDGPIGNGTGTNVVAFQLATSNLGDVVLRGENTFTGSLIVRGGRLILDYDTAATGIIADSTRLVAAGGTTVFRGSPTGLTTETIGPLSISSATGSTNNTANRIVVDPNGGDGTTLTVGAAWSRFGGFLNFTVLDGGRVTAPSALGGTPLTGATITTNDASSDDGVLVAATAYVTYTTDAGRTYFARQDAATFDILPQLTVNALPASDAVNTTNYTLSGNLTLAGGAPTNTLRIDTHAGGGTLELGSNNVSSARNSILFDGPNDYTINGTGSFGTSATAVQVFGDGALIVNVPIAGSGASGNAIVKGGPGMLVINASNSAKTGATTINEGILRVLHANGLTTGGSGSPLAINGGILEIGVDMNGATAGDFSRGLGTGANQVAFGGAGTGGFSAFSGSDSATVRVVNLGGAGAAVQWGAANSVNGALLLNSNRADAVIEFQNPLNFAGLERTIHVADNPAVSTDGARLTGTLSNGGLHKSGPGRLEIAGDGTYSGNTHIAEGLVLLSGNLIGTNAVIVRDGATLELGSSERINDLAPFLLDGGTFRTGGAIETLGPLSLSLDATIDLGTSFSTLNFADSSASPWDGTLSILNWSGLLAGGGTDQISFGTFLSPGLTSTQIAAVSFIDPLGFAPGAYGATLLPSGELVPVPEPAAPLALLGGLATLLGLQRRRSASRTSQPG